MQFAEGFPFAIGTSRESNVPTATDNIYFVLQQLSAPKQECRIAFGRCQDEGEKRQRISVRTNRRV